MSFWSLGSLTEVTCMAITCFIFWLFTVPIACFAFSLFSLNAFFSILKWWHRHDCRVYAYCLLYIFTICRKCLIFQFLGYGISMQILILRKVQKKLITGWKNVHNLLKNILFLLNFQDQDKLYDNCLFHILSFYVTCLLFQFLCCSIRMHILILRWVQNGP